MTPGKITVVGAGNVGATAAHIAVTRDIADIVLLDIVEGLPQGKALDIAQSGSVFPFSSQITGTNDWADAADSDIVIVTSGMPRKPGMSRDDLVAKNTEIVKSVSENIKKHCPSAFVIVVCNPLDAMVHAAWKVTGFPTNRIMGMAGALDTARFACYVSQHLGVAIEDIDTVLLGGHGDDMVPLPRFSSVAGVPLPEMVTADTMKEIIERTRKGGIEIVNLLGTSAYYAPAAGAVKMAESILKNANKTICCCAYCKTEYDVGGAFVGVPAIIGSNGIENIVEIDLNLEEKQAFETSVSHVKQLTDMVDKLL